MGYGFCGVRACRNVRARAACSFDAEPCVCAARCPSTPPEITRRNAWHKPYTEEKKRA